MYRYHDLDLSGSRDVIDHVTIRLAVCDFLLVFHRHRPVMLNRFRDIKPQLYPKTTLVSGSRLMVAHARILLSVELLQKYFLLHGTEKLFAKFGEDRSIIEIDVIT